MSPEEGFRAPQACWIVGITYKQADYWARTGLVRPSIADAKGSGSRRRYSYRDLTLFAVLKGLLDAGVSLQRARSAITYLNDSNADLTTGMLVLHGMSAFITCSGVALTEQLRQLSRGSGVYSIVDLGTITAELDRAVAEAVKVRPCRDGSGQLTAGVA